MMIAYRVGYSCYEDCGDLGYFESEDDAKACLAANLNRVGEWVNGDCIQGLWVIPIEVLPHQTDTAPSSSAALNDLVDSMRHLGDTGDAG